MDAEVVPTLDEAESHELSAQVSVSAIGHAHPRVAVAAALIALAAASAAIRAVLVGWVHGPFVFMDELGYERMAQTFGQMGHFSLFGKGGLAYSPLYPIVLSPIYALTSSMPTAYEWVKVENAVLVSLSVFPVYAIARFVLPRGRSVGVAALSLLAPLMLYSGFEMSESLAYPLCLLAMWMLLRAVGRPSLANDALLLVAIALASAARLQLVVLVPAALTAVLLVGLARPEGARSRIRATWRAVAEHWLLFGVCGVALVAFLARAAMNGGNLPLAGRYSNVGTSHASPLRVLELFFQHLAELDWAVGVIPFAAALLAGYALAHFRFPRSALVFASVAVASTGWMLLEVAYDAAAFDATSSRPRSHSAFFDLPRLHERYLIYLFPFFLVALFVGLGVRRPSFPEKRHLLAAAVPAALLPALIPFSTVINGTNPFDSFALLLFGTTKSGGTVPVPHATTLILFLSGLLALVFFLAASRELPALAAVLVTAAVFLGLSSLEFGNQLTRIPPAELGLPVHADWVDRTVGRHSSVSLVSGAGNRTLPERETAFLNASIVRVYYTCNMAFGTDFGEHQLAAGSAIRARYAVVPMSMRISGKVLARDSRGKLVLVAPTNRTLRIPSFLRCGR